MPARYLIDEAQDVYRLRGVKINDQHIEVIVRQMLRRIEVDYPEYRGKPIRSISRRAYNVSTVPIP